MADLFTICSQSLPEDTRVVGFRGTEALSRLYAFEVFLQITGPEAHSFDVGDAVGGKAALVTSRADDRDPFVVAGIFSEVALLHEMDERAIVRGVLVPHLWHLSQTLHSRLFTHQSIPDILEAVLQESAITSSDYELRLSGQYKLEEHVCQYAESDLDFLSRWMEREGLYYFFEHSEDGEKLIITDSKSFHKDLTPDAMRYSPQSGKDRSAGEHLESFVCRQCHLPASVRFKDYDYNKPTLSVTGTAPVSRNGLGEINLHGARLFTPDAAKRIARLRAELLQSRERLFMGTGTALYLRSGCTFSLTDHPRMAFDTSYLAIEVEHQANQLAGSGDLRRLTGLDSDEVYRVHVTAIPAEVQFRAEETTTWPRIYGTEHGVIDGEADSEYAQLDDHGRYLVRFAFDESSLKDGKASTWVRMMQPHGGGVEGWHFPLRKGTEVLFTFLGGDPDRPVIAGVVPNALTPSPVTRANHTKNVIQTGGKTSIVIEDREGAEFMDTSVPSKATAGAGSAGVTRVHFGHPGEIKLMADAPVPSSDPTAGEETMSCYFTYAVETPGCAGFQIGGTWWENVGRSKMVNVGENHRLRVGTDYTFKVGGTATELYVGARTTTMNAGRKETTLGPAVFEVTGPVTETVNGPVTETVNGSVTTLITGPWSQTVMGGITTTISGPVKHLYTDAHVRVTTGATSDTFIGVKNSNMVGGSLGITVGASLNVKVSMDLNLTVGESASMKFANDLNITSGVSISITEGLSVRVNNGLSVSFTPTEIRQRNQEIVATAQTFFSTDLLVVG